MMTKRSCVVVMENKNSNFITHISKAILLLRKFKPFSNVSSGNNI